MKIIAIMLFACLIAGCATQTAPLRRDSGQSMRNVQAARSYVTTAVLTPRAREVVLQALSHVGTPYQYSGRSPATGFDCSGLVQYVLNEAAGVALPREAWSMSMVGADVSGEELRPGDLVFFNTLGRPYSHVGIYVGEQRFIHAPTQGGYVGVADMRIPYWQQRYDGARRLDL